VNKTQIKERIQKLTWDKECLQNISFMSTPQIDELFAKAEEAKNQLWAAQKATLKRNVPAIAKIDEEIKALKIALATPVRFSLTAKIPYDKLPKKAQELCDYCRGRFSGGGSYHFVWISPKERHGIMYRKGHSAYIDRMSGVKYSQSQFGLVALDDVGASPYGDKCILHHEGRLSQEVFKKFTDKAKELEA
jgi:hypothetical protein